MEGMQMNIFSCLDTVSAEWRGKAWKVNKNSLAVKIVPEMSLYQKYRHFVWIPRTLSIRVCSAWRCANDVDYDMSVEQ